MQGEVERSRSNRAIREASDKRQPELIHFRRGNITPERCLSRQWSKCSLCSIDSCDEEELLPIPGQESHTSDMNQFLIYVQRVKLQPRFETCTPFCTTFWIFMKNVLEKAQSVGYCELPDADESDQKGPEENEAFIAKIQNTACINPINPQAIVDQTGISLDEVLVELLYAAIVGLVTMEWTPSCVSTSSGRLTCYHKQRLRSRKAQVPIEFCSGCRYKNAIEVLRKINVVFHLNSDVFYVLAVNFHATLPPETINKTYMYVVVPATFTGSGFRFSIGCGGDDMIRPNLPAGRYRMHCPVTLTNNYLEVERDTTDDDDECVLDVHVSDLFHYKGGKQRKVLKVKHGMIHMDIFTDTQPFFVCWILPDMDDESMAKVMQVEQPNFISAQRLMENPTYQSIFEYTEIEVDHFNEAVRKMKLDP